MQTTRFAPSPTGRLHLGHAYSAWLSHQRAMESGGRFLLRIEDIDSTRCKPEFTEGILEDLAWLGLAWEEPVRIQSEHFDDYRKVLQSLEARGLIYPCFCTRKAIQEEIARSGAAPHGPEGPVYPGTCRNLSVDEREVRRRSGNSFSLRFHLAAALEQVGSLSWTDHRAGETLATPEELGDVILGRKDIGTSYHLSVTVDDALQGITLVTRGMDLFHATHIHRVLQAVLEFPVPDYEHHPLLTDDTGRRFAKRDQSQTLKALRESGVSPDEVLEKWHS
ncbi:MAG: tRNA glutamyl-Q(34) synthetase GluQRS [Verrucomicrobiota bacterium]